MAINIYIIYIFAGTFYFICKSIYLAAYNRSPSTPGSRLHFSWWERTVRQRPLQWNIQTGGWTQLILRRKYNSFCLSFLYVKRSWANQNCSRDWSFPLAYSFIFKFFLMYDLNFIYLFVIHLSFILLLNIIIILVHCYPPALFFLFIIIIIICIIVSLVLCDDLDGWDRGRWEEGSRGRGYLYTDRLFSLFFFLIGVQLLCAAVSTSAAQ